MTDSSHDTDKSTRVQFQPSILSPHEQLVQQMAEGNGPQTESDHALNAGQDGGTSGEPDKEEIEQRVVKALKTIYDPEIPVNIYDLGLIYRVEAKGRFVEVDMTLTAPGCPVAQTFPGMVEGTVKLVPGVEDAIVDLVWDPPWRQDMISEEARLELGLL